MVQFLHFLNFVVVTPQYVFVLGGQLLFNSIAGLDAPELVEQVEGAFRGAELVFEGFSDELDDVCFNSEDAGFELLEGGGPLKQHVLVVDVVFKASELLHALLQLVNARLDR